MGLLELSQTYLAAMQGKGRRPETLRAYARDLAVFVGFVGDVEPDRVTTAEIEGFLEHLSVEGKAASSIIRSRDVIRAFWGWMRQRGIASLNPTEALSHGPHLERMEPSRPKPSPEGASTDEIAAVLGHLSTSEDRLVTALVAVTGLAASDILGLRIENVSFMNDGHPEMPGGVVVLNLPGPVGAARRVVVAEPDLVRDLLRQVGDRAPADPIFQVPMRTLQHRFRLAARTAGVPDLTLRNVRRSGSVSSFHRLRQRKT